MKPLSCKASKAETIEIVSNRKSSISSRANYFAVFRGSCPPVAVYHCWSSQINLQVINKAFPFIRPNQWKISGNQISDILVNYKWGALLEMKEILWLRFKARRMPSTLFLCVPGWPEIEEQNSHALSLYITSHHWIRFIGPGFHFKTISKLLRQTA